MDDLSRKALLLKVIFQQLTPGTFQDVIDAPDAYIVVLRGGKRMLARLDEDNSLRLTEIDEVC